MIDFAAVAKFPRRLLSIRASAQKFEIPPVVNRVTRWWRLSWNPLYQAKKVTLATVAFSGLLSFLVAADEKGLREGVIKPEEVVAAQQPDTPP